MSQTTNSRRNPFSGAINWTSLTGEQHTIALDAALGIYGFRLYEKPSSGSARSFTVVASGGGTFTEILTGTPAAGEVRVDFGTTGFAATGFCWFHSSDTGKIVSVNYYGGGSIAHFENLDAIADTAVSDAGAAVVRGSIDGLTISNSSGDPTNDIDVAAGQAANSTNTSYLTLSAALTGKQLDAAWAVGSSAGMRDAGAIANGTWFIWLIKRSDTGVVDVLASLSATAPTMPTNYDLKRRIGAIIRSGAAIVLFDQVVGDIFLRKVPVSDYSASDPGTSAVLRALSVPVGIRVVAIHSVDHTDTNNVTGANYILITDPAQTDTAASSSVFTSKIENDTDVTHTTFGQWGTDTSARIRIRIAFSSATITHTGITHGWIDRRGRDA